MCSTKQFCGRENGFSCHDLVKNLVKKKVSFHALLASMQQQTSKDHAEMIG